MNERTTRTLGQNINYYRMRKNFTQKELADKIEMSIQTLSRIENDAVNPTSETLIKIMKALQITPNQLFGIEYYENIHLQLPFARNLKAIRENAHVTIENFARALKISVQELNDMENGTLIPSKELLNKICENLYINEEDLTENSFHRQTKAEFELLKTIKSRNNFINNLTRMYESGNYDDPDSIAKESILFHLEKLPFKTLLRVYKNSMNEEISMLSDEIF